MDKNTKILIVGRTGSGKSTIEDYLNKKYGFTGIKSYTTRPQRGIEDTGHIFITEEQASNYKNLVSSTEINGYKYFATEDQLKENDIYVIDVIGMDKLFKNYPHYNYIVLNITSSEEARRERTASRTNFDFESRQISENEQFYKIENTDYYENLRSKELSQVRSLFVKRIENDDFKDTERQLKEIFG